MNFLIIFIGICMWVIGTLFGSFFSLAFHRIPRHEDIVIKNSYCPKCKHKLNFFDLIPVLSFCIRGGRCKYCKEKISSRYILLELLNGTVFVIAYLFIGYNVRLLCFLVIYILMFFVIGTIISKNKFNNIYLMKKNKKGVFLSELVVAIIFFAIILTSMYIVVRNSTNRNIVTVAKANALNLSVKNIEILNATNYEEVESFSKIEIIDNINYYITINVSKLSDEDHTKEDIVKKIAVIVRYNVNGKDYNFSINTVKGRV